MSPSWCDYPPLNKKNFGTISRKSDWKALKLLAINEKSHLDMDGWQTYLSVTNGIFG